MYFNEVDSGIGISVCIESGLNYLSILHCNMHPFKLALTTIISHYCDLFCTDSVLFLIFIDNFIKDSHC